jgi:hypothetical protein
MCRCTRLLMLFAVCSAVVRCSSGLASSLIKQYDATAASDAGAGAAVDINRIVVDEETGTVYAASQSAIYRLNEDLTLRSRRNVDSIVSTVPDVGLCGNFSAVADDEQSLVLALDPASRRLLFCPSTLCGLCSLVDADSEDLTGKTAVSPLDPHDPLSFVGPSSRPYALFAGGTDSSSSAAVRPASSSSSSRSGISSWLRSATVSNASASSLSSDSGTAAAATAAAPAKVAALAVTDVGTPAIVGTVLGRSTDALLPRDTVGPRSATNVVQTADARRPISPATNALPVQHDERTERSLLRDNQSPGDEVARRTV